MLLVAPAQDVARALTRGAEAGSGLWIGTGTYPGSSRRGRAKINRKIHCWMNCSGCAAAVLIGQRLSKSLS